MKKLILLTCGLLASAATYAQSNENIENLLKKLPKISGYVQIGYQWSDNAANDESTFNIRRARVAISGELMPKFADYKVQAELSGSPKLLDAYVRFTPYKSLNVQVGQYKVPFTIENVDYSPTRVETIEYPMALERLLGSNEKINGTAIKSSGRDLGASLYGSFLEKDGYSVISYQVGVFNGIGINAKDNNSAKDFAGRINIRPIKELTISGSFLEGEWGETFTTRRRYAFGAAYENPQGAILRSEYLYGKTDNVECDGVYVLMGYNVTSKFSTIVRYDTFNENKDVEDVAQTNYLVGVNYKMNKNVRLQVNYTLQSYEQNHSTALSQNHRKFSLVQMLLTGSF